MKERGNNPTNLTDLAARVANMVPHSMDGWMGPQKPLKAMAQQVEGRQFDFPVGYNLRMQPRSQEGVSFQQLRNLADAHDVLRIVIETRKDEIAGLKWRVSPIEDGKEPDDDPRCSELMTFLKSPDREHGWDEWLRMLLEDLIVLDASAKTVACRVRRYEYLERYGEEFTVRSRRDSGAQTELSKIIAGWGDYLVYAFADADERALVCWHVVNLNGFRLWFNRYMAHNYGVPPGTEQPNRDGSSRFRAFRLAELPADIVTTQHELEAAHELVGARAVAL